MQHQRNQGQPAGAISSDRRHLSWRWALCTAVLAACSGGDDDESSSIASLEGRSFYAAWAASPQSTAEAFPVPNAPVPMPPVLKNQTVRQVVHLSAGGSGLRVRLSNVFGSAPLIIDKASIAGSTGGAAIAAATLTRLTFGGAARASIPAGQELWSDLVNLATEPESNLAVTLFVAGEASAETAHSLGQQTTYVSAGDQVSALNLAPEDPAPAMPRQSYYWLTGVDVARPSPAHVVVAFGDSITDGLASTVDASRRYPNVLSRRLQSSGRFSVVNEGISGNRVLSDVVGPSAVSRFRRDVLGQSGVTATIILIGINDIGFSGLQQQDLNVEALTSGLSELIAEAKGAQLQTFVATLLPLKGTNAPYYSETSETKRQAVNEWIRAQSGIDGVVDFDRVMGDPADPLAMRPSYDSMDHLHPNDAGYEAMANAVDLELLE